MTKLLVDTSIIIDFLRARDKEAARLADLASSDYQLYVSIITHTELYAGKSVWESKRAENELEILFSGLQIVPLDKKVSRQAGRLRAAYDIDLFDAIIAASAEVHGMFLATLNIKHFSMVDNLQLLFKNQP